MVIRARFLLKGPKVQRYQILLVHHSDFHLTKKKSKKNIYIKKKIRIVACVHQFRFCVLIATLSLFSIYLVISEFELVSLFTSFPNLVFSFIPCIVLSLCFDFHHFESFLTLIYLVSLKNSKEQLSGKRQE